MKLVIFAVVLAFAAYSQAQMMGTPMPLPLPANQAQQVWQQFFTYRLMFGDAAARLIMADKLASMMGGSPFSRYYAGEYFDTPDLWWMMSSMMNRNQGQGQAANMGTGFAGPIVG